MNKEYLRTIITDQQQEKSQSPLITRSLYEKIKPYLSSKQILVISGIRRCGKSTLLQQIRANASEADFYLNFDDERLIHFTVDDFQSLLETFIELYGEQKHFYFDEIQNVKGWERFVRHLHDEGKKVFVTGSNASILSRELGTHLTGRYYDFTLYPFSFVEFLKYHNVDYDAPYSTAKKANIQNHFRVYLQTGGMPEYVESQEAKYLHSLYENILYRDIVTRYQIGKVAELKELVYYVSSNIGKEVSFNKLKTLLSLGSASTVKNYFDYLENSFLFFLLPRISFSSKKQIYGNKKVYTIDNALAKTLGFRLSEDWVRLLENVTFIELLRREKEIYYHREKTECDFITRQGNQITGAIQVIAHLQNPETKMRELNGLIDALQTYNLEAGLILTQDEEGNEKVTKDGKVYDVTIKPLWKWLLEDERSAPQEAGTDSDI